MATKTKATATNLIPVVVTTSHRGVFFGYATPEAAEDGSSEVINIERARMCVSWGSSIKGVVGLAAVGPDQNCRISHAAPKMQLRSVTAVFQASPEAAEAWEAAPWS